MTFGNANCFAIVVYAPIAIIVSVVTNLGGSRMSIKGINISSLVPAITFAIVPSVAISILA